MRLFSVTFMIVLASATSVHAVPEVRFLDTQSLVERSENIVIVKCLKGNPAALGITHYSVEVVDVLKGQATVRTTITIGSSHSMAAGKLYFVAGSGGAPNFASNGDLRTVELPASFQLPALKGKTLVEQVNCIFAARMRWLESQLPAEVLREYALLDKAVRSESEIDVLIQLRQARERHKVARPAGRTE